MLGAGRDVETLPVPTLFAKLTVARRVDARRRRNALLEGATAARGSPEQVQQLLEALGGAAGVPSAMGDVHDLMRALSGG